MNNEAARLRELLDLQILDTEPEAEFDEIAILASEICQTPIALVSLIDSDRQWFKSQLGVSVGSTPRAVSFCHHVVAQNKTMVIPNALEDPRFKDLPFVTSDQNIRFYAGSPLITQNGYSIGTLCVLDRKPRILSDRQVNALEALSRNIIRILELRRQNEKMKDLAEQISRREILMIESAKMSSLGQMAGGIAHEINNPLTIISLYGTKIKDMIGAGKFNDVKALDYANRIQETTQRIAKIIRGMRDFCGDGAKGPFQKVKVRGLIEETLAYCNEKKSRLGIDINLVQLDQELELECRPVQISQVILNLLNNACDALAAADTKRIEIEVRESNGQIQIQLHDTGSGIPVEAQDKIFQPFFTTKEVGQGIGLGLSISKGIIESHKGTLTFRSSPAGTIFKILIPKIQTNESV